MEQVFDGRVFFITLAYETKPKPMIRNKMFNVLLLFSMILVAPAAWAQEDGDVHETVEDMPEFQGGVNEMFAYLGEEIEYPVEAKDAGVEGTVVVSFVVEKDGSISSAEVLRSLNPRLDAEAVRVVEGMPEWEPGFDHGKPVRVQMVLPIRFLLDEKNGVNKEK